MTLDNISDSTMEELHKTIAFAKKNGLAELEWQQGDKRIKIRCYESKEAIPQKKQIYYIDQTNRADHIIEPTSGQKHLKKIMSPMVGTFYIKPKPDASPFVKIGDSGEGCVFEDGTVSKSLSAEDKMKRDKGIELAKKVLLNAGCDPNTTFVTEPVGSHYCGTAALDKVVDRNLETRYRNLYVCDTSILPRSPGRPPALTAIALGKWLAVRN